MILSEFNEAAGKTSADLNTAHYRRQGCSRHFFDVHNRLKAFQIER